MRTSTRALTVFCLLLVVVTAALILANPVYAQTAEPPPDTFWVDFAQALALQFGPLLAGALVAWALKEFGKLWLSFKNSRPDIAEQIASAARMAVLAAEQSGAAGYVENKKSYALKVASNWLAEKGLSVNIELISAAIEAAVFEEFNRFKREQESEEDSED